MNLKVLLVLVALAASAPATAQVYAFSDEHGVLHLSNVPDDLRYRPLDEPVPPARPATPASPVAVRPLASVVEAAARASGLDPALIHAVISVESGYDARAVSRRGAAGLMQLMEKTAARYGVTDRFDPAQNVRAGAQHLHDLLRRFDDDLALALAAYNAGPEAVLKYGRAIPPYPETRAYVPRVLQLYAENAGRR